MKLQFLWDEQKTRQLLKAQILTFAPGVPLAVLYGYLQPNTNPYRGWLIGITGLFFIFFPISWLIARHTTKIKPGWLYLFVLIVCQTAVVLFMTLSGGLSSIQYVPYVLLMVSIFQLGPSPTLIYGGYAIITFIFMFIWDNANGMPINSLQFLLYAGLYAVITAGQHNLGREISLQFEAKKRLEQIDDLKNQFITLSSHYLRTPLTVMKGYIAQIEDIPMKTEQKQAILNIRASIQQLESLVEKFLLISSIERGNVKLAKIPTDPNLLLKGIVDGFLPIAAQRAITFNYANQLDRPLTILADPTSLRDALSSIIDNAIKFNKQKGMVNISLIQKDRDVVFTVQDTGQGINHDQLGTLFSSFNRGLLDNTLTFTTSGVGISLYLAKLIIDAHQGTISVTSKPGYGSTFTIQLPITDNRNLQDTHLGTLQT